MLLEHATSILRVYHYQKSELLDPEALSMETSVFIYESMWPNTPQDLNLQVRRRCVRATSCGWISDAVPTFTGKLRNIINYFMTLSDLRFLKW